MTGTAFNLLTDPLIGISNGNTPTLFVTLPQTLERLGSQENLEFPLLQAHHQHPWHAFLVQLAGLALLQGDETKPTQKAADWKNWLEALAPHHAWCLVNSDLGHPAFLQPAVPEGNLSKLKNRTAHPDRLDLLVTAKNHEVKAETIFSDDSLTAARLLLPQLITYQTFSGFSGRGNYGVARMNGGFGSRVCVGYYPSTAWTIRFQRDLKILLKNRDQVVDDFDFLRENTHSLLWLLPWSGTAEEALSVQELDPFFIEVCRRVRTSLENDRLFIHQGPTKSPRVLAKNLLGNIGDPWTPIRVKDNAALTISDYGFNYRLLAQLLLRDGGQYCQSAAQETNPEEPADMLAVFSALVRGQGKTGGYHERHVPIPSRIGKILSDESRSGFQLASLADARIIKVADVKKRVLKPALLALAQGGTEDKKLNLKDDSADPWLNTFDHQVDRLFFRELFEDAELSPEEQDRRWHSQLRKLAILVFDDAAHVLPRSMARNLLTVVEAESLFRYKLRDILPSAFDKENESIEPDSEGTPS